MRKSIVVMSLFSLVLVVFMLSFVYAQTCFDSDNGVNYYSNGQVVVSENETSLSYNDACVYKLEGTSGEFYVNFNGVLYNNKAECSDSNCYVAEGFCENNAKKWTIKTCLNGCSNGVCLCPTTKCSDGTIYSQDKCNVKDNVCECPACPAIPETCKQEGGVISWQDSSSQCCGGLAKIIESSAYSFDCSAVLMSANSICTNCGNTLCGLGESKCNCPYDCKTESNGTVTPACQSTKCDDGTVYICKVVNGICSCPACPAKPLCTDSDGGINYYVQGSLSGMCTPGTLCGVWADSCIDSVILLEYSCENLNGEKYTCPNGCKDGVCIKGELIKEQVTCIFQNSDQEQRCYTAYENERATCSGIGSCVASILGYNGEQITWKSSCGEYQYTAIDGNNEKVGFNCISGETNISSIINKGFKNAYFQCYDGAESKSTDREACKSADYWKKFASNFCAAHCENNPEKCKQKYENQEEIDKCLGKCGINTFSIGNECYLEESATCGVGNLPPCQECKTDNDCYPLCGINSDGTPMDCTDGVKYKCIDEKCASETTEPILVCKDSCALDRKCYPFGYRKGGNYCSDEGGFIPQIKGDETCDNNFECSSNVCVSGKCVSEGFIEKIMNWFQKLFGGE